MGTTSFFPPEAALVLQYILHNKTTVLFRKLFCVSTKVCIGGIHQCAY